ncbi:uncharacterized protein L3040_002715 [Drepanopeziza brunnea f. sp. 'multigermtubi']|uniref:uncharacterized protein n=1 Tax=Drepanopeziza brunnea f. sp. 'multigermtubi' TaxID=698441 RepID=UPI0023905C7C|nr:hypothetical protein L3040_002715 [Drepanopeziza brunnea f. sp. 'multigermtubi']
MLLPRFILPSALLSLAYATPTLVGNQDAYGHYQVMETVEIPDGYSYQGPADPDTILNLRLIVKSAGASQLSDKLDQISNPTHADYGKHLSQEQLASITEPEAGTVDLLTSWLAAFSGVSGVSHARHASAISFKSTVAAANLMLAANFGIFQVTNGDDSIVRSLHYSLPEYLTQHVGLIHPITFFPKPSAINASPTAKRAPELVNSYHVSRRDADPELLAACTSIYPSCIAKLYNIDYTPPVDERLSGSSLGVVGFLEQTILQSDVTDFVRKYGIAASTRANPGNFTVELVNGGTNIAEFPGAEATLDMQYSMSFTGNLPVVFYSVGGRAPTLDANGDLRPAGTGVNEPYLEWLEYMLAKPDGSIPQVLTISYTDTEQGVPRSYATHVCDLFGRLAARGVSIIDASGDGGIAGQEDFDCVTNDAEKKPTFLPTFPASCPYVTAVGATSGIPAYGSAFSSGGFSNYFEVPAYQKNATASYISYLDGQYDGMYNASGRGIPDVAISGSRYQTENNNVSSGFHPGTSGGTAVFGSMIALVNDARLRAGKPVLGWLNPTLYAAQTSSVWNDIQTGNSYGCGLVFNATEGWDTITGLGTPDFARLMKVLG